MSKVATDTETAYRVEQKLAAFWPDKIALEALSRPEAEPDPKLRAFYVYEKGLFVKAEQVIRNAENREKVLEALSNQKEVRSSEADDAK